MFGGAGVGKTVLIMELIRTDRRTAFGHFGLRRDRRALARGARAAARTQAVRRACAHGARVRTDERAARRALAGRADGARDRRVFSRRRPRECAAARSTTSTAWFRQAAKCRACSAACLRASATSPRSPARSPSSRSASPRLPAPPSLRYRRSMCRPTISPTRRWPRFSAISIPRSCCPATWQARACIRRWTRSPRLRACSIRALSARRITAIAQDVRKTIAHYRDLQEIIALLGIEELSAADRRAVKRARRLMRFLTQPFMVTVAFTGKPGRTVELEATLAGCRAILRRRSR